MGFFDSKLFKGGLGAAGILLGMDGRNSANRAQQRAFALSERQLREAKERNRALADQANAQRAAGIVDVREGFDSALGAVRAGAESGRVNAARLGGGVKGRTQLAVFDRGLAGTSAGKAVNAAAANQANQGITDIDAQLAQLTARLQGQKGTAVAGARSQLASGLTQAGQINAQSSRDIAELHGSRRDTAYNPLSDLLQLGNFLGTKKKKSGLASLFGIN